MFSPPRLIVRRGKRTRRSGLVESERECGVDREDNLDRKPLPSLLSVLRSPSSADLARDDFFKSGGRAGPTGGLSRERGFTVFSSCDALLFFFTVCTRENTERRARAHGRYVVLTYLIYAAGIYVRAALYVARLCLSRARASSASVFRITTAISVCKCCKIIFSLYLVQIRGK